MKEENQKNEAEELGLLDIEALNNSVDFNNCHLVVKYLIENNPRLIEAIVNEYEAQIRFGEKK